MAANRNQLIHSHIAQSLGHLQSLLAGTIQPPKAPGQALGAERANPAAGVPQQQAQRQQALMGPLRQQKLAGQVGMPGGQRGIGDPGYYAPPGFLRTPHAPQVPNPATGITPTPQPAPVWHGPPGTGDLMRRLPPTPVGLNRRPY